jgi:hypothetical protein
MAVLSLTSPATHKLQVNAPDHMVGLFTHLRLRLEHQLCLEIPRLAR